MKFKIVTLAILLCPLIGFAQDPNPPPSKKLFDAEAFTKKMRVQNLTSATSFFGFKGDPQSEKYSMGLAIVTYKCRGGHDITLIPMIHIAEQSYFKYADSVAKKADLVLFENIRPAFFSGPPFDNDPTVKTPQDYVNLTMKRLQTMAQKFQDFRSEKKRDLISLAEFFEWRGLNPDFAKGMANKILLDAWGHPLQFRIGSSGHPTVVSLGLDGVESPDDMKVATEGPELPINPGQFQATQIVEQQRKLASDAGLTWQFSNNFESCLSPKAANSDISSDMLAKDLPLDVQVANTHLRNLAPILKIEELIEDQKLPKSVAIMYGTDHMLKFHQYLTGKELACTPQKFDWQMALDANHDLTKGTITEAQLAVRKALIEQMFRRSPVLEVDVSGLGDALRAPEMEIEQPREPAEVPTFGKPLF